MSALPFPPVRRDQSGTDGRPGALMRVSSPEQAKSPTPLTRTAAPDRRPRLPEPQIRFALDACSLGALLVAQSQRGMCAILLGDTAEALLRELQGRFPRAVLVGADPNFGRLVAQVVNLIEQPALGLELPLDIQGTPFQQQVWQALQQIPAGTTASYAEIAKQIGAPKAARAVARACAANPMAVAIPCHRVIRHDGGLAGYRWGIERKRQLLARERRIASPTDPDSIAT